MAKFELTGKIENLSSIVAVPTKSGSINKREVILTILRYDPNTGEPTGEPNHVTFEFSGERDVPKLEAYKEGDMVTVAFYLSGRNYTGKDGVEHNFTKVVGYDISPYAARRTYNTTPHQPVTEATPVAPTEEEDTNTNNDLPF